MGDGELAGLKLGTIKTAAISDTQPGNDCLDGSRRRCMAVIRYDQR